MKISRLASPANPSGAAHHRVSVSPNSVGNPDSAPIGSAWGRCVSALCFVLAALPSSVNALNLAWNPNPEPDIAAYQLSYGTRPGVRPNLINAGTQTTASVTGLQEGLTYYFAVTTTNQAGIQSAPSAEVSYQVPSSVPLIPRSGWQLKFVSSQETEGENGAAINAFDGDPGTIWHSQWDAASPPPPHEIQIDLGAFHPIQGFRYLPRQDSPMYGNIGQYEFYISMDGITWGPPAGSGTFANTKTEKEVLFPEKSGRYVRLRALSDASGATYCSIAELAILQGQTPVSPTNQAPVAVSKSATTAEDSPVGVVLSATDADGNPLTYSIGSAPSKGTLSGTAPNLKYAPNADFSGVDSFTYKANDGTVDSNIATVSITVSPVNDAPVAAAKSVSTSQACRRRSFTSA